METKKNPAVDLTKKSGYYFSIGLLIAMSIVVAAFEWRQETMFINLTDKQQDVFLEWTDVRATEVLPPPPIPVTRNIIVKEVDDNIPVEEDSILIDIGSEQNPTPIEKILSAEKPETSEDIIVDYAEISAAPKEDFQSFYKYVGDKIKYPAQARRMGVEGKVFVQFVINKDGSLSEVKAIKGIGAGCDEEAVRIIESVPNWNPGRQGGKPVRQRYTLPIFFKLG